MTSVTDILNGIKARLKTINGLDVQTEQPAIIKCPCAWPVFEKVEYETTFEDESGDSKPEFTFSIIVAAAPVQLGRANGYAVLMPYLAPSGAKSVTAAFDKDVTLGGVADSVHLESSSQIGEYESGGVRYIGGKSVLTVYS
jgi:hypothetical protein